MKEEPVWFSHWGNPPRTESYVRLKMEEAIGIQKSKHPIISNPNEQLENVARPVIN